MSIRKRMVIFVTLTPVWIAILALCGYVVIFSDNHATNTLAIAVLFFVMGVNFCNDSAEKTSKLRTEDTGLRQPK